MHRHVDRYFFSVVIVASNALTPMIASAQAMAPIIGRTPPPWSAFIDVGWDPTFVLVTGGSRAVSRSVLSTRVQVDVAARVPMLSVFSFDAWQVTQGLSALRVSRSGLGVSTSAHVDVRLASDDTGTKLGLGAAFGTRPGYYARTWTITLDLLWAMAFATYMWHSDAVKDLFRDRYPESSANEAAQNGPQNGWYAFTSHRFRFGIAGGTILNEHWALHSAVGFAYTPQIDEVLINPPYGPLPFYISVGGAYRW